MITFVALLLERLQHFARVAVVALFVLTFVAFSTATRSDWFGVVIGVVPGLFFGLVFAFGGPLEVSEK
jgi:hypothetical protein